MLVCVCFSKQKTADEMRISDWSSDVCSSDLLRPRNWQPASTIMLTPIAQMTCRIRNILPPNCALPPGAKLMAVEITNHSMNTSHSPRVNRNQASSRDVRSEERSVGKECGSQFISGWSPEL